MVIVLRVPVIGADLAADRAILVGAVLVNREMPVAQTSGAFDNDLDGKRNVDDLDLTGRVAIVTGAGRGIGKAIATELARRGASAVVATRTESYGEAVVEAIRADGGAASLFSLDVAERQSVQDLVEDTASRYGRIDILVHSAATVPFGLIGQLSDEDFEACQRSIASAAYWLTKYAAPQMIGAAGQGTGRIVFITSVCGTEHVVAGLAHYAMAKNSLEAFTRAAALELGPKGITVNGVSPGLTHSDRLMMTVEQIGELSKGYPIARAGTPMDIANAVLFLISPQASYITGHTIVVDGGSTLMPAGQVSDALET